MTAANSPLFWTGLLPDLAALYVLPTTIAVIRPVEDIPLVVILNCFPIAWPAALLLACIMPRPGSPVATRCLTGVSLHPRPRGNRSSRVQSISIGRPPVWVTSGVTCPVHMPEGHPSLEHENAPFDRWPR